MSRARQKTDLNAAKQQQTANVRKRSRYAHKTGIDAPNKPRALILVPTGGHAHQIYECIKSYGQRLDIRHVTFVGGIIPRQQVNELHTGLDILVATPNRLIEFWDQGQIDLSHCE